MIDDEEIDQLRAIADRVRAYAEQSYYGFFHGGDPRNFSPDPECSTAEELEQHKADCAAWEAGNNVERHVHAPLLAADGKCIGHTTTAHYGLGVNVFEDPELMKLAQDLDDVIDRIRQVEL